MLTPAGTVAAGWALQDPASTGRRESWGLFTTECPSNSREYSISSLQFQALPMGRGHAASLGSSRRDRVCGEGVQ